MATGATTAQSGWRDSLNQAGLTLLGGLTLHVNKGSHRGARFPARNGRLSVGSGLDNEAVLLADNLAPAHFTLNLIDSWRGVLRVEAKDQAIRTRDGKSVDAGRYIDLKMPAHFQAGDAEFEVVAPKDTAKIRKFALPVIALLALAILLPSLVSLISGPFRHVPTLPSPLELTAPLTDAGSLEKWQEQLREKVREATLGGQVMIERGPTGNLVAVGSVDPASLEKWRDVLKWYDALGNGPLLVNNVSKGEANAVLPNFRAVWVDSRPQVVLSNGQSAGIGDTIPGGWKIEAIDNSGVLLSRDGRISKVAF